MNTSTSLKSNRRKIRPIVQLALETIVEWVVPDSGVLVKACFFLWDLVNDEEPKR
jgi:hypothetical protein